jgi:hypothetical protein
MLGVNSKNDGKNKLRNGINSASRFALLGLLIVAISIALDGCGYILRQPIKMDSVASRDSYSLQRWVENDRYNLYFEAVPESSHYLQRYYSDFPISYVDSLRYDLFVFLGTRQSRLDDFIIKPNKIQKSKLDGKPCLVYLYGEGCYQFPLKIFFLYDYLKVYIQDGKVVKMGGWSFEP